MAPVPTVSVYSVAGAQPDEVPIRNSLPVISCV